MLRVCKFPHEFVFSMFLSIFLSREKDTSEPNNLFVEIKIGKYYKLENFRDRRKVSRHGIKRLTKKFPIPLRILTLSCRKTTAAVESDSDDRTHFHLTQFFPSFSNDTISLPTVQREISNVQTRTKVRLIYDIIFLGFLATFSFFFSFFFSFLFVIGKREVKPQSRSTRFSSGSTTIPWDAIYGIVHYW